MKTDIIERIDQALAENRQVKQQRMQAHVMWLLDNPTQLAVANTAWERVGELLWKLDRPGASAHLCVRCLWWKAEGDYPWCSDDCDLWPWSGNPSTDETTLAQSAGIEDLPQPLHRGSIHVRPMVSAR